MNQENLKVNELARGGLKRCIQFYLWTVNLHFKFNIDFRTVEIIYCM